MNALPVIGVALAFVSVIVSRDVPEAWIDDGAKAFATVGGSGLTVSEADAADVFAFAFADVTAPTPIVFV